MPTRRPPADRRAERLHDARQVRLTLTPKGRKAFAALDEGSRTSAALAQILLRKRYGIAPEVVPLPLTEEKIRAMHEQYR